MYTNTVGLTLTTQPTAIVANTSNNNLYILSRENRLVNIVNSIDNTIIDGFYTDIDPVSLVLTPDNTKLIVGNGLSESVQIFDALTGEQIDRFFVPARVVNVNIDGKNNTLNVLTINSMRIYDIATLELVNTFTVTSAVTSDVFNTDVYQPPATTTRSPNSYEYLYIINSDDQTLTKYNLVSSVASTINLGVYPQDFVISRINRKAYITNYFSEYVSVIDLDDDSVTQIPCDKGVCAIAIDDNNNILYLTNSIEDKFTAIDLNNANTTVAEIHTDEIPSNIIFDPVLAKIIISNYNSKTLTIINAVSFKVEKTISLSFAPYDLELDPLDHMIYISSSDTNSVYKFSIVNETILKINSRVILNPYDLYFDTQHNILYVLSLQSDRITFIDTLTNKKLGYINLDNAPKSLAFDEYINLIYITHFLNDKITIINSQNYTKLGTISTEDAPNSIFLFNTPTTLPPTTTPAPAVDTTLTIGSASNFDALNFVTFYGNLNDTLEFTLIPGLSEPLVMQEIIITHSVDGDINRITIPSQYVDNNVGFILTVNDGNTVYTSSFGSGVIPINEDYRRIEVS